MVFFIEILIVFGKWVAAKLSTVLQLQNVINLPLNISHPVPKRPSPLFFIVPHKKTLFKIVTIVARAYGFILSPYFLTTC